MSLVTRGTKNAFRNGIRTGSIILILAISIGLALVMLLSMRAVNARIQSVKGSIGNTITVTPAGERGFAGGGNPLTTAEANQIKTTPHVTGITASLTDRLSNSSASSSSNFPGQGSGGTTNLVSSINPGQLGQRFGGGGGGQGSSSSGQTFTLPISVTGTTNPTSAEVAGSSQLKITSGSNIDGNGSQDVALVGTALASKNNLKVGSTFTAYNTTITVSGIYDAGNTFNNAGIIMPLATVQTLSAQPGDITSVLVQVDSITNVSSTSTALQNKLGSSVADVVSSQDTAAQAITPLQNIKTISLYSLVGALVAGAIITFLVMLMIVRERRREIGVLKAIGAGNGTVVGQFVVEALTLTVLGAIAGTILGVILSNPILKILVSGSTQTSTGGGTGTFSRGGNFGGGGGRGAGGAVRSFLGGSQQTLHNIHAVVSFDILFYGLGVAVLIAILGSAIPAWLIAKVRPAEVMRVE